MQLGEDDRLDEMAVEAGLLRAAPVLGLAPAGDGDDRDRAGATARRAAAGRPRSRSGPAGRCRAGRRRGAARRRASAPPGRRARRASRGRASASSIARLVGASPLSSTTSMRMRAWPPRRRRLGAAPRRRAPLASAQRQRDDELAAPAGPVARRDDRPPCISTSRRTSVRPMPSPPCGALERASTCANRSNTRGEHVGRDADAVVADADDARRRPRRAPSTSMRPPSGVYLRGVVEQVAEHLREARRGRRRSRTGSPAASTSSTWPARSISRPARLDRVRRRPRAGRRARGAESACRG